MLCSTLKVNVNSDCRRNQAVLKNKVIFSIKCWTSSCSATGGLCSTKRVQSIFFCRCCCGVLGLLLYLPCNRLGYPIFYLIESSCSSSVGYKPVCSPLLSSSQIWNRRRASLRADVEETHGLFLNENQWFCHKWFTSIWMHHFCFVLTQQIQHKNQMACVSTWSI